MPVMFSIRAETVITTNDFGSEQRSFFVNDYFGEGHFGSLSRQNMTGKTFTQVVLN